MVNVVKSDIIFWKFQSLITSHNSPPLQLVQHTEAETLLNAAPQQQPLSLQADSFVAASLVNHYYTELFHMTQALCSLDKSAD